jgi:hypothetical protein
MKLTQEHIDQLYKFTRAHFVEWYDLQTELVDHLANDIENIWEKEPNLSFDQAKTKAFKKFGIFGFQDVIADKSKSVNKRYWKLFGQIFKDYFKLPKITLTLMITLLVFSILRLTGHEVLILITIFWIIFIFPIVFGFRYKSKLKRRFKKTGKKWMVDEVIKQSGLLFLVSIQIPIQLLRYADTDKIFILNSTELLVASFMLTVFAIFVYILTTLVPPKLEKEMCKLYPEYKVYLKA